MSNLNKELLDGAGGLNLHRSKLDTATAPFVKDELIRIDDQSGTIALVDRCTQYGPCWTVHCVWQDGPNKGSRFSIFNKNAKELDLITRLGYMVRDKGTGEIMSQETADAEVETKQAEFTLIECDICGGDIVYTDLRVFDRITNDPRDDCTCDEGEEKPRPDDLAKALMAEADDAG